jgi:hypothetical protein
MLRKIVLASLILVCVMMAVPIGVSAEESAELNLFYSPTCPHCHEEMKFLEYVIGDKYPDFEINQFSLTEEKNLDLMRDYFIEYKVPQDIFGGVPITFIGEKYYIGFNDDIARQIENQVVAILGIEEQNDAGNDQIADETREIIDVPIFGEINLKKSSPLTLAIVLGTLDGFNACAMIALGFLLTVLIGTGVRKKVILIGGTFILVSGAVYFLFITAWLNLFIITQNITLITTVVSIIVIVFAVLILRDYIKGVVCKLCNINPKGASIWQKMEKYLFSKMEYYTTTPMSTFLMLLGVAGVAVGINAVELICSFGFPLAFSKALTDMGMSTGSYYFYLILYVIFYMIDDFIIFLIAVVTLRVTGISNKYLKFVTLISGIVLLLLGVIMLFKPELLAFSF